MSIGLRRAILVLGFLAGGLALTGCHGGTQNPARFPFWLPSGDIVRTHGKPPGRGYFENFDPKAVSLVVRPLESSSPVRTSHVLIATVYDKDGQPRRKRRVEWMLEGAGNIVEVDESGFLPGRGYKVDNKYAVSYTDFFEHKIDRGNDNPNDDFVIRPGQSWCVISSPVEGDTHVTVYAPEIHDWEKSKVHLTHHWIDAQWTMPAPAAQPAGSQHVLTTAVTRASDRQPLANYRVRYRVLDGPPAVFVPSQGQEAVAISDLRGAANVTIAQPTPQSGSNRVAIEIIRAPDPTVPSAVGIVIGQAETRIDWLAPAISLNIEGPPTTSVGAEAVYTLRVTNPGQLATRSLTVRHALPEGFQYVRSEPPANVEPNVLVWTLGELSGGQSRDLQATFRATRPDQAMHRVTVQTEEGLRDEKNFLTLVAQPGLRMTVTGPPTGSVGVPIAYRIQLSNPGTGPASRVMLKATFDAGLESETRADKVEMLLDGQLAPGQTRDVPLVLTPRQAGNLAVRVTATADGNLTDQGQHAVLVQASAVTATITGPQVRFVGRPVTWDIQVSNGGQTPLANVIVRNQLPAEVEFAGASDGGQATGREVVWNLGALPAGERKRLQVTVNCTAIAPAAVSRVLVTALTEGAAPDAPPLTSQAEAALEIRGVPAFRLNVTDTNDPVEVGGRTTYRIEVMNQGSLRGNAVQVTASVPRQMRIVSASGPAANTVAGQKVTFEARDGLESQQTWTYTVEVEAREAGDARFEVELRAGTLSQPVVSQQSTAVFAPGNGRVPGPP